MFCNYCGAENPGDAVFCQSCGKQQTVAARTQTTESVILSDSPVPEIPKSSEPLPREQGTLQTSTPPLEERISPMQRNTFSGQRISQSAIPLSSLVSSQTLQQNIGALIAGVGGILALFAFFFLPYLSLGFLGSLTGSQLASMNNQFIQGTDVLWLEQLVAAAAVGIAGYTTVRSQRHEMEKQIAKGLAICLIVLAAVTLVVLLIKFAIDAQPPTSQSDLGPVGPSLASFYGAGMWIYFIAILAVLVGGIAQVRSLSLKK